MAQNISLAAVGITNPQIAHNLTPSVLIEEVLRREPGSYLSNTGALMVRSGQRTGRSPKDKRVVVEEATQNDVWWGDVNIKLTPDSFAKNRQRAIDFFNTRDRLYVVDGLAGWDPRYQIKVRVICTRAYHALFMRNMLIVPNEQQLLNFGTPDFVIYNAGQEKADPTVSGVTGPVSVALSTKELVILGTEYAGEMKKGVFSLMNYLMPKKGVLSMHCSANVGDQKDLSLFFGLSGTGKTTLSADPHRHLIGDDEHCWTDQGIFNIEGGCYAKAINLRKEKEPEIFNAIRYGAVLENVIFDQDTRAVDYDDQSITENTRACYPLEAIPNVLIPALGPQPKNVVFLTCDAFGVLPPVSKLTPAQAEYHFISGYTAKVAGTEMGVKEPQATFSACFGAAFMVWHPGKYAQLLSEKIRSQGTTVWLVNTGWTGGGYGEGNRMSLPYTRGIIDAINSGELEKVSTQVDEYFGLQIPESCPGVPSEILRPERTWKNPLAYDEKARHLAKLFKENFKKYESGVSQEVLTAGPKV